MKTVLRAPRRFARLALAALIFCRIDSGAFAANASYVDEVLKLKGAGLADDTIVAFIESHDRAYELSADDVVALKDKGLPSTVLNAMLASGRATAATAGSTSKPAGAPPTAPAPSPGAPLPGNPAAPAAPAAPVAAPAPVAYPTAVSSPAAAGPDVAYFYQELSPYGRWVVGEDNQWYWQPTVAVGATGWRPYWDNGRWIYTDSGWFWSSDYPWGWAAFHYGRWRLHPHFGWVWRPDRVWAPAWVVWRSGGEYCGWAPLPPGAQYDVGAGRFLWRGRRVEVGFDFGLEWSHFNFCYVRELGERHRWHPGSEVEFRGLFGRTTIVVGARGGERHDHFFNRGIEPSRVGAVHGHPIETVHIRDMNTPAGHGAHERFQEDRRTLEVYRPRFERSDRGRGGNRH